MGSPPDLSSHHEDNLNEISEFQKLRQKATIIPVGIGIDKEIWNKFMAFLMPEYQKYYAKDEEFSGNFLVKNMDELVSEEFIQGLNKYLCLVTHRSSCRTLRKGNPVVNDFESLMRAASFTTERPDYDDEEDDSYVDDNNEEDLDEDYYDETFRFVEEEKL